METVILVAGVINATGKMLYWICDKEAEIGDYAVVKNMNGFDLIKIVGFITTDKSSASKFSNTKYENMKNVLQIIKILN